MPSIVRSLMFLALVALAALPGQAVAGIGVTSAASGDPLGRPPTGPERVLRVGIDIEANERVTTTADDRAHVVFLDGTSVTIGPNSILTIDKYVFDPNAGKGDMGVTLTKGVFRLVGGKISKSNEVTIATPSSTIGIRGGIVTVTVQPDGRTTADFLHGDSMRVTSQGVTQTAKRSGSRIESVPLHPPSHPSLVPFGAMSTVNKILEKPAVTLTVVKTVTPVTTVAPVVVAPVVVAPVVVATQIATVIDNSKLLTTKEGRERDNERERKGEARTGQTHKGGTGGVRVAAPAAPQILKIAAKPTQKVVAQQTHGSSVVRATAVVITAAPNRSR